MNAEPSSPVNGEAVGDVEVPVEVPNVVAAPAAPAGPPVPDVCLAGACRPLFDKCIVQLDPPETINAGGQIVIPDAHTEEPSAGTVLTVGEGRLMEGGIAEPRLKPGMRVLVGRYGGIETPKKYGDRIKVVREDEVLWIFPEGV